MLFTQETISLFPLKTNKNIYIYLFFHVELRQSKSVWPQSVDSPNLKLRIKACPPWAGAQQEGLEEQSQGGQAYVFPFSGGTRPGELARASEWQLRAGSQHQVARSLSRDLTAFSLGPETSGKGVLGTAQDTGIQGAREKDTDHVPLQSACGPWQHCSPVTKPAHLPPPHPHLSCGVQLQVGLLGPQPWPTTVMSPPLFPDPLFGRVLQDHPTPLSSDLSPEPPPLLSSPHLQIILIILGT